MYIDKSAIEDYLLIDIDGSMDSRINEWIAAAQNYVEIYTGREFELSEDETRYYDGPGGRTFYLDDFTEVSGVWTLGLDGSTVDETLTEDTDYFVYPLNDTPKHIIKLAPEGSKLGKWPKGKKRIKVTADFGYQASVPDDIKLITTQLVAEIVNVGRQGAEGGISSESLGDYSATYGSFDEAAVRLGIKPVLDNYKLLVL